MILDRFRSSFSLPHQFVPVLSCLHTYISYPAPRMKLTASAGMDIAVQITSYPCPLYKQTSEIHR
jgi:hypothetical protein